MKISKIEIKNYRLLKNFSINLENELSLVIGKNNCGKTSLLSAIDKFLNSQSPHPFSFNDFNLDFFTELKKTIQKNTSTNYKAQGIALKLFIDYGEEDNLANIKNLMMDLDPNNNKIVLLFEYVLTAEKLDKLNKDFIEFKNDQDKDLSFFLKNNYQKYFKLFKKTIDIKDDKKFIDIVEENISLQNVINYKFIPANREVSNKDSEKSLSMLSANIYDKVEKSEVHQSTIDEFKNRLHDTDDSLTKVYADVFESVVKNVKKFGGIKPDDTNISITSTLQHKNILKGNTTVLYEHRSHKLPENYNGLGYMNLINIIFEIEIKINEFKRAKEESPADINLLFIEEPEAHTHPQMQYVFIKNIKKLLEAGIDENHKLQYIVSTHSAHIVAESDFDDIKYLKNENNAVIAKDLKSLESEYKENGEEQNYKFLKQYLTLHRAELFFADKAIFIEGDTERILLPAIMKKIDQEYSDNPLLSQNISIIETGNYSHIFEKFIDFIGVKSLIITDIDSATDNAKKCKVDEATITTNASLKFFYDNDNNIENFKDKTINDLILKKNEKKWIQDEEGFLLCAYQTKEKNSNNTEYHARSFEDSFLHLNRKFIIDNEKSFKGLKNIKHFKDESKDAYYLSENCIGKKPAFAIEILLNSDDNFTNWQIPSYIYKGLLWLKK